MKTNTLLMLGLVLFSLVLLLNAAETPQDDKKTDEATTDQFGGGWGGYGGQGGGYGGPGGGYGGGYGGPGGGYGGGYGGPGGGYGGGRGWGGRCRWGCCGGRYGGGGFGGGWGGGGCRYCCRSAQEAKAYNMMPDTAEEANP